MRFLDTNIIIYSFFVPKRVISTQEQELKTKSRKIIESIDNGKEAAISIVHLSEAANVLRSSFSAQELVDLFESFYSKENITILEVSGEDYLEAVHLSRHYHGKINDCLAAVLMRKHKLPEIYTFDKDFTLFPWVKVIS